jgi:predicted AAA+ superfamily ATPase
MGKSSLVKAVHGSIIAERPSSLKLIEIHREDIASLPHLMRGLRDHQARCLLLCDDLSFEVTDTAYKSLKTVLDGGLEGRPSNILLYATSNRRHLMPRDMVENEQSTAINPGEAVEEKVSLSDRFGLWLGFHNCSQDDFLNMVDGYVTALALPIDPDIYRKDALTWAAGRGARSGRVAFQFIQDLAGRLGVEINPHAID